MTKVIVSEDCGNSPKNIFIKDLTVAFAKGNSKFLLNSVTDDIRWNIIGDQQIRGKENFSKALKQMGQNKTEELTVQHIATHGKAGAVNGVMRLKSGRTYAFCDMYEFKDTKGTGVKEITSYVIEIK